MLRLSAFPRTAVLASTFALAGSIGCKQEAAEVPANEYPGQISQAYCAAVFGCPCTDYPYANANECFADLLSAYDAVNDEAYLAGLSYDGTCPAAEIESIESLACRASVPDLPEGVCVAPCNPWHGSLTAGFPCQTYASSPELGLAFSNCAQGLTCLADVCVNPCQAVMPLPAVGQPCPEMLCAAGAMCDAETMTCVATPPLPGPGEACAAGVCDPKRAVCVAAANVCAALPSVGQMCIEGQCDADSYCGGDNVCIGSAPLACGLLGGGLPPGDGDGDTGDGDGDTGDGDGDGDGDGGDFCATEFLPDSLPVVYPGDSSAGVDEYIGGCDPGGPGGPEAKLSFVAPTTGIYTMSTEGSPFDTILYVRGADCSGPDLACDDDTLAPASYLEVQLTAGQEVTVFVDGYETGGSYILQIDLL